MYFIIVFNKNKRGNKPCYFLNDNLEIIKQFKNTYIKGDYISSVKKLINKYNINELNYDEKIIVDSLEDALKHIYNIKEFDKLTNDITLISKEHIDNIIKTYYL
jgi:hypothetical protein